MTPFWNDECEKVVEKSGKALPELTYKYLAMFDGNNANAKKLEKSA